MNGPRAKPITAIAANGKVTLSVEDFGRLVKAAGGELTYITSYSLIPEPKPRAPRKNKKTDKIK